MKEIFIGLLAVSLIQIANCQTTNKDTHTIDLFHPPKVASLFMENLVSTSMYERDFAISPDGTEILFTTMIPFSNFQTLVCLKKGGNAWTGPEVVSFSGKYSDLEPAYSADGKKLFFSSNRPVDGEKIKDFDIWYVEKENGKWGKPQNIGAPINTEADEFYPSVATNGNLYFTAEYKGGIGREDIYMSRWENDRYQSPTVLDSMINSAFYEFNAFISPGEEFIIFSSQGRKDEKGRGDLYLSMKDPFNKWKPAVNLTIINSDRLDYCPFVSYDKKILFFTSESHDLKRSFEKPLSYKNLQKIAKQTRNGFGNIYWIDFSTVLNYLK